MKSIEIIPTNTCPPDFEELARRTLAFASFAPHVQLDVSDGKFSPVLSWPYQNGQWRELQEKNLPHAEQTQYEIHLMVEEPREVGELLINAGAKRVMGHIEAFKDQKDTFDTLRSWKARGAEVGLAALFKTPLETLEPFLSECDVILLMSIGTIGKQGAPYEPSVIERIEMLRARHPAMLVAVDGGVSRDNIAELARAGVTRFGVGSAITRASDPRAAYEELLRLAESAV
jgi:ribulose-phosphate 3-epimerase